MQNDFYKRFDIPIDLSEAKRHFMNRIRSTISMIIDNYPLLERDSFLHCIEIGLGAEIPRGFPIEMWLENKNFWEHLRITEAFYACLDPTRQPYLSKLIEDIIALSECDLGISWQNGKFYKKGAPILDQKLVNESLGMLRDKKYENVVAPFEKGLKHLLQSQKEPERLADAIRDVYEALEALAKIVCESNRDLSGNRDSFIAKIDAPEFYKKVLKEYIDYACEFRHALKEGEKRRIPSEREVKAFIYLTGIFIRLAL